jgi:hypothetical protein
VLSTVSFNRLAAVEDLSQPTNLFYVCSFIRRVKVLFCTLPIPLYNVNAYGFEVNCWYIINFNHHIYITLFGFIQREKVRFSTVPIPLYITLTSAAVNAYHSFYFHKWSHPITNMHSGLFSYTATELSRIELWCRIHDSDRQRLGYRLDDGELIPNKGKAFFPSVTSWPSWPLPDRRWGPPRPLYALYNGHLRVKRQGREADRTPPSSDKVKIGETIPPLLHRSPWRDA